MAVLRYWAGARAAAGVESERVDALTLAEALDAARAGRDERFRPRPRCLLVRGR